MVHIKIFLMVSALAALQAVANVVQNLFVHNVIKLEVIGKLEIHVHYVHHLVLLV